jgi:hypothetical protein
MANVVTNPTVKILACEIISNPVNATILNFSFVGWAKDDSPCPSTHLDPERDFDGHAALCPSYGGLLILNRITGIYSLSSSS